MSLQILSPVAGRAMPLAEVPDPVFAGLMVGPGVAVDPTRAAGTAVAPISGTIVKLHPHAYVISSDSHSVLVHLGIDTVQLKGEGFTVHATEGEQVAAGDPIVSWDPAAIEAGGKSPAVPVVTLEGTPDQLSALVEAGEVAAGDVLFVWG
jgi:PTS system N-acetylglucosamine-specific IIA component